VSCGAVDGGKVGRHKPTAERYRVCIYHLSFMATIEHTVSLVNGCYLVGARHCLMVLAIVHERNVLATWLQSVKWAVALPKTVLLNRDSVARREDEGRLSDL
jgi:hypothetical protein